jgi:predicted dehydrogenase
MAHAKIRIAVAGLGRIGWRFHCGTLAKHRDYKLVAMADTEPDRRREAEDTFGVTAHHDYYDMLEKEDLDAVAIATPTHLHKAMALAAFRSGRHVMLEKPMAMDLPEARAIVRAAAKADLKLTVYQPNRARADFQHLRRLVESGVIGRVYWVRRGMYSFSRRNDWQSLRRFGGGMLNNYGAHGIDQILNLIGYDVKRVFGDLQLSASMGDADDVVKVVLETRQGAIGEVDINQASTIRPDEFLVWGVHGGIVYANNEFRISRFDPGELTDKPVAKNLAAENRQYPSADIRVIEERVPVDPTLGVDVYKDFAGSIRKGTPPMAEPEQILAVMRVIAKVRESSHGIRNLKREA